MIVSCRPRHAAERSGFAHCDIAVVAFLPLTYFSMDGLRPPPFAIDWRFPKLIF